MGFRTPDWRSLSLRTRNKLTHLEWRKLVTHLPALLLVAGLLLLAYVGSEYFQMYREQKMLAAQWAQQENDRLRGVGERSGQQQRVNDGIIRLQIPKIDLDAYVLDGAGHKQLKVGVGRITTTAIPGEKGNAVVTAHRDTFFRHIADLKKGDEIIVRRNGERMTFQMTGYKIVKPTDVSVLKPTPEPTLTLITCYPTYYIGPAPERLVVSSKLVSREPDNELLAIK
jgi:LPXTG-site transpeptidase (sortase) family protein